MLTNDLVERGGGYAALVLDDYHVITADSVQRGMTFLLEQLHLILATRADPPLPLTRLRAQGQLNEVLRNHLQQKEPTLPPFLHWLTSAWSGQHVLPAETVQHALAIPDAELAVRLIEPIALPATFQGQISTVLG